jgi:hypothetical protein
VVQIMRYSFHLEPTFVGCAGEKQVTGQHHQTPPSIAVTRNLLF